MGLESDQSYLERVDQLSGVHERSVMFSQIPYCNVLCHSAYQSYFVQKWRISCLLLSLNPSTN